MGMSQLVQTQLEGLLWENQRWFLLNSDSSGGRRDGKNLEAKRLMGSTSSSPRMEEGGERLQLPGKKRGREGQDGKKGKEKAETRTAGKGAKGGESGGCSSHESEHEMHIWTERERRKKMRTMFSSLHAMLPNISSKADKSTIVDAAVKYIKTLQETVEKLEKQKQGRFQAVASASTFGCVSSFLNQQKQLPNDSREAFLADHSSANNLNTPISAPLYPAMFQTWTSSNVVLNICGDEAQFCVCSVKKAGLFATVCFVLEKYKIEVLSAHISSGMFQCIYMIQAHLTGGGSEHMMGAFTIEETFKQAAGDIILWVSS